MPPKNDEAGNKGGDDRSHAGKNMPAKTNDGAKSGPGRDNLPEKKMKRYKIFYNSTLKPISFIKIGIFFGKTAFS